VTSRQFRVNRQIRIPQVRLIDEKGEQLGIVNVEDARRRAEEVGLDLVEVSPTAVPPVCRILDFGKFKYEQRKKDREGHKHHLEYRVKQGREFLIEGHKVQVVCVFKGRQMDHPEHGYRVMQQVAETLADVGRVESTPRMLGKRMTMLLAHK
jgi:translation initiation factor IF-3